MTVLKRYCNFGCAVPQRCIYKCISSASTVLAVILGTRSVNYDLRLHIGESRDSGFALRAPRNDRGCE
jgi:hypothetical protein